ncbi:UTRA domain-containing protein [Cryptosporangium phraense]|uniref:UTRA domain-containing protein n=1 Tax=Cryptosporangium phraense TaxID=2593070 RepID=UPI0014791279|nr:UTRA domain-containing protein [Cryptosporangium phraense]
MTADQIRGQILTGQLQPGDEVPAIEELQREGWTEGTRVRRRPDSVVRDLARPIPDVTEVAGRLAAQGSPVDEVIESVRAALPTPEQVATLDVPAGLPVLLVRREFWSDGDLVEWTEFVLPGESTELRYALPT